MRIVGDGVPRPSFGRLQRKIMDVLWAKGPSSIREIQQSLNVERRPAYTTVQTVVYRLEIKNVVRRMKKIGNAHIFEATISRKAAVRSDPHRRAARAPRQSRGAADVGRR
jgi:predicted transcriptional regulator